MLEKQLLLEFPTESGFNKYCRRFISILNSGYSAYLKKYPIQKEDYILWN